MHKYSETNLRIEYATKKEVFPPKHFFITYILIYFILSLINFYINLNKQNG